MKPVQRGSNIYTRPSLTPKLINGESYSSRNISRQVGYNRRVRGPQFPVQTTYTHVDSVHCKHCLQENISDE